MTQSSEKPALLALLGPGLLFAGTAVGTSHLVQSTRAGAVFGLKLGLFTVVGGVMALTGLFLAVGRYHWLERLNKLFMLILSLSTIAATILVLPRIDWALYPATAPAMNLAALMFVAALAGWMPTPIETSVFSSAWTVEKAKDLGKAPPLSSVTTDFNLGYWGTAFLAVCFLLLGAGIMHTGGTQPADSPSGFALQVMGLYEETLGAWSVPIVGAAAISVMFTTCLSVYDGAARSLVAVYVSLRDGVAAHQVSKKAYPLTVAGLVMVAFVLLLLFVSSFKVFIDFVTSLAFVTAPVLAYLNHRVIMKDVAADQRPPAYLMAWSRIGIAVLTAFAMGYLLLVVMR